MVEKVGFKGNRVAINAAQYFEDVPGEVWGVHIGSCRVAEKWLKDRKGRALEYSDLAHYQNIVAAIAATLRLMRGIDEIIEARGSWPLP